MSTTTFDRPIIILSAPRSGSTLLFETLSQIEHIWTIGDESHAVIEHIPEFSTVFRGFESNALHADDGDAASIELLKNRFEALLRNRDGIPLDANHNKPIRFLEKTPKNSLRVAFLNKVFPDALFIYLVRDPKDNINSIIDAWQSKRFLTYPNLPGFNGTWSLFLPPNWQQLRGKTTAEIASYQWQVSNQSIISELTKLDNDRWQVINYNQLINEPSVTVKQICDFIGLTVDAKLIDKFKNGLPLSQYTLTKPKANKWHNKAHLIAPVLPINNKLVDQLNHYLSIAGQQTIDTEITDDLINNAKLSNTKLNEPLHKTIEKTPTSRNSPCPCGSGKRFKQCHGLLG